MAMAWIEVCVCVCVCVCLCMYVYIGADGCVSESRVEGPQSGV
jgi:hypothetical protein